MNKLTDAQVEELSDYLTGTCHSVNEGLIALELDVFDYDDCKVADQLYNWNGDGRCDICGWWDETTEARGDEFICDDCHDAEDEEYFE